MFDAVGRSGDATARRSQPNPVVPLLSTLSLRNLRRLDHVQLAALAAEIRAFLVHHVTRSGGHLGPNLGVVELTIAVHRVFRSPVDIILWDTGHQAYVHKILTGRRLGFERLRRRGGLSGYPCRVESEHGVIENSQASTALSWADGIAKARELSCLRPRRHIVAVVGDGALTGGMAWEALNNIAAAPDRPVIIVLNDNACPTRPLSARSPITCGRYAAATRPYITSLRAWACTISVRSTGMTSARWNPPSRQPRASAGPLSCTVSPERARATRRPNRTGPIGRASCRERV